MGDTIGVGTPASVAEMFKVCSPDAHLWCGIVSQLIADCDSCAMLSIFAVAALVQRLTCDLPKRWHLLLDS